MKKLYSYTLAILFFVSHSASGAAGRYCNTLNNVQDTLSAAAREADTTSVESDLLTLPPHTVDIENDSLQNSTDTLPKRSSSLAAPVFSKGRDSTIYDFTGRERMVYYYGDVTVTYENLEIKAEYMAYNIDTRIVFASGVEDTTGTAKGNPVMKEGGKEYAMKTLHYNFSSRKARINNVITQEGDGYLHGNVIKKMPDNSINISEGKYTTCDLEHPHFYLQLSKAKVTPEPNSQTIFGPAYLVIEDVPTPLALPFGFIPKRSDRSGGFLFPTFGEEASRGFYVTGIGWYLVFGEYFDLAITGDYYTLGSWGIHAVSRYKKMYGFDGNFNFDLSENVTGLSGSTDYSASRTFRIGWNHRQDAKANPTMSFNASVNFMSSSYRQYNSVANPQNALQSTAQSSISFRKTWEGTPFNLSVNLTHSQNMRDSSYALAIPNFTFSMNTVYPFKRKNAVGKERFYEQISIGYNTTFDNKIAFKESEWGQPDFWNKVNNGMKHNFNIGLPAFRLFKHINISPSVTYGMNMYFQGLSKAYNDSTRRVEDIRSNAFSEFHITNDYSFGIGASTRLYGLFSFGKNAYIQAFRHMVSPSLSASFRPETGTRANGHRTFHYVDSQGAEQFMDYNAYAGVYAPPGKGKTGALSFSLDNNFEMKVRNSKDTVNGFTKIKLIDNFRMGGSYNFLADSMKLSVISLSLNTNLFGKVAVTFTGTLDPYTIREGRKVDLFSINDGKGLARLTNAGFSFGYQFQGGETGIKNHAPSIEGIRRYDPETGDYLFTEYRFYEDFSAPWSLGFNYSFTYNSTYPRNAMGEYVKQNNYIQSLGLNGQIKLTKAFDLSASSGFDFKNMELTTTTLNIHYDLHCFEFSLQWTPFGRYQSWSFRFNAKSAMLADLLKYDKRASYLAY